MRGSARLHHLTFDAVRVPIYTIRILHFNIRDLSSRARAAITSLPQVRRGKKVWEWTVTREERRSQDWRRRSNERDSASSSPALARC